MDMMLLGETLFPSDVSERNPGFWMPAGGNDGVAGVEVFFAGLDEGWEIAMETKSSDEDDSAATPIGNVVILGPHTTPTSYKFDVTDAKDLVRYTAVSLKECHIHLQFAQPLWHPN